MCKSQKSDRLTRRYWGFCSAGLMSPLVKACRRAVFRLPYLDVSNFAPVWYLWSMAQLCFGTGRLSYRPWYYLTRKTLDFSCSRHQGFVFVCLTFQANSLRCRLSPLKACTPESQSHSLTVTTYVPYLFAINIVAHSQNSPFQHRIILERSSIKFHKVAMAKCHIKRRLRSKRCVELNMPLLPQWQ